LPVANATSPNGGGPWRGTRLDRRAVVAGALALSACHRQADAQASPVDLPALKAVAAFPVGTCVGAQQLQDPAFAALVATQTSQLTAEWEMKMEYIAADDGSLRFDAPDAIAAFARAHGQRLFGHTLVWYAQAPAAFERLPAGSAFADAYRTYIATVVGRYRGVACGWDVVNEAVAEDGVGWRDSLWSRRLGALDHMVLAYRHADEADPSVPLFLNDYNLESLPAKLAEYQRLIDRLLKAGAPVSGIGCQTHANADLAPGSIARTIQALGAFGLPIHVSEMDVSVARAQGFLANRADLEARQARLYQEAAHAFAVLPERQRFAFTVWGLRDKDSWLCQENAADTPLLFDNAGQPKPAFGALARGFGR
jgi:endo-1,4-beta-xylanase